jgi:hypothetical protein
MKWGPWTDPGTVFGMTLKRLRESSSNTGWSEDEVKATCYEQYRDLMSQAPACAERVGVRLTAGEGSIDLDEISAGTLKNLETPSATGYSDEFEFYEYLGDPQYQYNENPPRPIDELDVGGLLSAWPRDGVYIYGVALEGNSTLLVGPKPSSGYDPEDSPLTVRIHFLPPVPADVDDDTVLSPLCLPSSMHSMISAGAALSLAADIGDERAPMIKEVHFDPKYKKFIRWARRRRKSRTLDPMDKVILGKRIV